MDKFPDDLTFKNCMNIIKENQNEWKKETRKLFTDQIMNAAKNCDKKVELIFPKNLWGEHKKIITKELLDIFLEFHIRIKQKCSNVVITKLINDCNSISDEINSIIITFHK